MKVSDIYFCRNYSTLDEATYRKLLGSVPPERKSKAERYVFYSDRCACIVSYILTVYGIRKSFGLDVSLEPFSYSKYGKPYFERFSNVYFNISHCKSGLVCAVSDSPAGVDVQDEQPVDDGCYDSVLSERELRAVQNSLRPGREFIRFWSLKESYVKYLGVGLNKCFKEIDVAHISNQNNGFNDVFFKTWDCGDMYISVCGPENRPWHLVDDIGVNDLCRSTESEIGVNDPYRNTPC